MKYKGKCQQMSSNRLMFLYFIPVRKLLSLRLDMSVPEVWHFVAATLFVIWCIPWTRVLRRLVLVHVLWMKFAKMDLITTCHVMTSRRDADSAWRTVEWNVPSAMCHCTFTVNWTITLKTLGVNICCCGIILQ